MKLDFVEQSSTLQKVSGKNITYGATAPTSPALGDVWFEIGDGSQASANVAPFGNPWVWTDIYPPAPTSRCWLSQPIIQTIWFETNVNSKVYTIPLLHKYADNVFYRSQIIKLEGVFRVSSANDATNYWGLSLGIFRSDAIAQNVLNPIPFNTQSLGANIERNVSVSGISNFSANGLIVGNTWNYRITTVRTGTPTGNFEVGLSLFTRMSRY